MDKYSDDTYGEKHADVYDGWYASYDPASITTLTELACGGRALELGIGTGRIAIPLAANGVEVHGIDASPSMIAKLRSKPGGGNIPVLVGNFADVAADGQFDLVYVVINTFFTLRSQQEQVRCFGNVARLLTSKGLFALEAFVPDMSLHPGGQSVRASAVKADMVSLHVSIHDPVEQRVAGQQIIMTEEGIRLYPVEIRYAWPSELDLMAALAGLKLQHRWSSWRRDPFTSESKKHISIYGRKE